MGLGVISSADFDREIAALSEDVVRRVPTSKVIDMNAKGRGNKQEVPKALKKVIAEESISGAPAKILAETFGVSQSSISAYKNDATSTSTYDEPDPELKQSNDIVRHEIVGLARTRLQSAISNITDEKLADAKLRDIASVARDMSAVIKNMEPEREGDVAPTQFIFFAPRQREETQYKVIDVGE